MKKKFAYLVVCYDYDGTYTDSIWKDRVKAAKRARSLLPPPPGALSTLKWVVEKIPFNKAGRYPTKEQAKQCRRTRSS